MSATTSDLELRSFRMLLATVGLVVFVVGITIGVLTREYELGPVVRAVGVLGSDYLVVSLIALLALALAGGVLAVRSVTGMSQVTPPPVETVQSATSFGADIDAELDALWPVVVTKRHRTLHARLRHAAIDAIVRTDRCRRDEAEAMLEEERWTDDSLAASFVATEELRPPPLSSRLLATIRREPWFDRAVDRTVRAIERRGDGR